MGRESIDTATMDDRQVRNFAYTAARLLEVVGSSPHFHVEMDGCTPSLTELRLTGQGVEVWGWSGGMGHMTTLVTKHNGAAARLPLAIRGKVNAILEA